jgi:hypothetical protein
VLAHSAFHHSANYRSVCVFGTAQPIEGEQARIDKMRAMMERLFPGRWELLRPVCRKEINATRILAVSLAVASAKVRAGAPDEDPADLAWPTWSGVIPLHMARGAPVPDEAAVASGTHAPDLAVRGLVEERELRHERE